MPEPVKFQPGDLFVLKNDKGLWENAFTYEGIDLKDPTRILGRATDSGNVYSIHATRAVRPKVALSPPPEIPPACDAPLTAEQRRCIFGLGKSRGMDIDDLRELTPAGSISALTRSQADGLIAGLQGRADANSRKTRGSVTGKQVGMVHYLCDQIGFTKPEFSRWLARQFGIDGFEKVYDGRIASRIIAGLVQVQRNKATRRRVAGIR